jgi:hypothetical protein
MTNTLSGSSVAVCLREIGSSYSTPPCQEQVPRPELLLRHPSLQRTHGIARAATIIAAKPQTMEIRIPIGSVLRSPGYKVRDVKRFGNDLLSTGWPIVAPAPFHPPKRTTHHLHVVSPHAEPCHHHRGDDG